jgi:hypothetical protein
MEVRNLVTGGVFSCDDELGNRLLSEGYEKVGGRRNVEIEDPEKMKAAFDPQVEPPVTLVKKAAPRKAAPRKATGAH